jgi:type I restriction enzyme S subunit
MVNASRELPDGWIWKTIGEVTLPIEKVDPTQKPKKEFTYLDIASIDNSLHKITEPKSYYGADAPSRARQLVQANDVLFSTVRTYLEKIAQVPEIYDGQIASTGFSVLRANESVLPKYLFYYSLTQKFLEPLNELQRGTSYPAVRDSDVRVQTIPVAPLPEQERIVAKIEELFTQLEAGTSALERVQAGLRRYKASVLKAAVEGKLLGDGKVENGELSDGWQWKTLEELSSDANYGTSQKCDYDPTEFPVVRIPNIVSGSIDLNDLKYAIDGSSLREKDSLEPGDLLIIRTNGSKDLIGKSALIRQKLDSPLYFASYLIRYKINDYKYVGAWISTIWDSPFIRSELEKMVATTAGQYNLNIAKLNKLQIPLPPLEEQRRIVAEVERRLSVARQVESAVEEALVRASRLRQAVLRSAFEGRFT